MMNKKILSLFILGILLISFASASINFMNIKSYNGETETIKVKGLLGIGGRLAEYNKTYNTGFCLEDCYAEGTAVLYSTEKLFDNLKFEDFSRNLKYLKESKILIGTEKESYEVDITDYKEICNNENCSNQISGSHKEIRYKPIWKDYHGEILNPGVYDWRIEGKKNANENIEWIATAYGKELREWDAWGAYKWYANSSINESLAFAATGYADPSSAFYFNDNWYLIRGEQAITCKGFVWNSTGANWIAGNTTIAQGFRMGVQCDAPSVFKKDGEYYALSGQYDGTIWGFWFNQTNSTWMMNSTINRSLLDIGGWANPTVFWKNSYLYSIIGEAGGTYWGFVYDDIAHEWIMNKSINASLPDMGTDVSPSIFNISTTYYLLAGSAEGNVSGWVYDNTALTWSANSTINDSLLEKGQYTNPSAFWMDGTLYSLVGHIDGGSTGHWYNVTIEGIVPPVFTYIPPNTSINYTQGFGVDFNATDETSFGHFAINWTDTFQINQSGWLENSTPNVATGQYYINVTINDSVNNIASTIYWVNITLFDLFPEVQLFSPANLTNFSTTSITFSLNATDDKIIENLSLILDGEINYTVINGVTNYSNITITLNVPEGAHNWTGWAFDNSTALQNKREVNYTFYIDTTPPTLNLTAMNRTLDYFVIGTNITFNWTIDDPVGLSICIITFADTNITVPCLDLNISMNMTGYYTALSFFANDSFGNAVNKNAEWKYKIFQHAINYSESTIEGATELFQLNVTKDNSVSVSVASLIYNGTSYSPTIITPTGNNLFIEKEITIPHIEAYSNVSFHWNINLTGGDSLNSNNYNQSVKVLSIDNCTSYSVLFLNYSLLDEENQFHLTDNLIELSIKIYDYKGEINILNFSKLYEDTNPARVCLNINLTKNYTFDAVAKYTANESYVIEYHNIIKTILNNESIPYQINLYDLLASKSTDFKITFTGSNYQTVENALIFIDRQYIPENNTFKTVELPKTDSNGQTIGHFVRNNVLYNIRVIKDNIVLGNFQNIIAFCQDIIIGDCQIYLNTQSSQSTNYSYNETIGVLVEDLKYNVTTGIISGSFVVPSGTTKTIKMNVTKSDIFGNSTICSNSLTSSSGSLSCTIGSEVNEATIIAKFYVNNVFSSEKYITINKPSFGSIGYLIWFILSLILIFIFDDNKTGILISLILSYVGAITLGLTSGSMFGIGAAGIWVIVISLIGIWKLNKDKEQ